MDLPEKIIKNLIREEIWKGICLGTNVNFRENPYSIQELLEQNQFYLNQQTEELFEKIKTYLKD